MGGKSNLGRRTFLGAGLVGAGAAAGWLVRTLSRPNRQPQALASDAGSRYQYDISAYETTDPELLLYRPAGRFETGFERARRLTALPDGKLLVVGDRSLRTFDAAGERHGEIELERPPRCAHLSSEGELFVGLPRYFAVHDLDGKLVHRSAPLGERAFLTAIATHEERVFAADAGNREVLICDREGAVLERFGKKDAERKNPGFNVPSPYFDLEVTADGRLCIANPGLLRVETYSLDGRFLSAWGEPGMKVERFSGCCNPVYFTQTPDGGFITSEKGLARVKVYGPGGRFLGLVAGPDFLVDDKELAKRACRDCRVGAGFDVALGGDGRVFVLDPFRMAVRVFEPA